MQPDITMGFVLLSCALVYLSLMVVVPQTLDKLKPLKFYYKKPSPGVPNGRLLIKTNRGTYRNEGKAWRKLPGQAVEGRMRSEALDKAAGLADRFRTHGWDDWQNFKEL